ncbi:hypothetical protein [Gordonia sp. 852002-51296_SCH5728562-b]|uniref:hypothetical protein n=1 Tax=Gordonia sp. 852002-51296_SCH5728562-b TaxID=1834101 RepID=UPI0007EBA1AB|nr:hypothetical protein [Gordonia sp. 852002-51296_SCH5728562-b]OBA43980.1 hypothetical protein A5766_00060 [Gordonia sp. 852002-51296_SCH5728562-b]
MTRGHLVGITALLVVLSLLALIITGAVLGGGWRWAGAGAGATCAAVMVIGVVAGGRDSKGDS